MEGVLDPLMVCDDDRRCVDVNAAGCELFGRARVDVVGRCADEFVEANGFYAGLDDLWHAFLTDGRLSARVRVRRPDGQRRDVEFRARANFEPGLHLSSMRDVTDRVQAEERLALMLDATAVLTRSIEDETTLESLAHLLVPRIADWCGIDLLEPKAVAIAHTDRKNGEPGYELRRRSPSEPRERGLMEALEKGKSVLYPMVSDEQLSAWITDSDQLRVVKHLGGRSGLVVPLIARGRRLGSVSLVSVHNRRRYGELDVRIVEKVASRAALAIDNAMLQQESRVRAARLSILADASREFAEASIDPDALLGRIAAWFARVVGDVCVLRLLSGAELDKGTVWHRDPVARGMLEALLRPVPVDTRPAYADAVRTGKPARFTMLTRQSAAILLEPEIAPWLERFGLDSMILVPLRANGRVIGTLCVGQDRGERAYDDDDVQLVQELSDRAALLVQTSRAYVAEQAARREAECTATRMGRLQAVTAALSEASSVEHACRVVTRMAVEAIGASASAVALASADGTELELLAAEGMLPEAFERMRRFPPSADHALAHVYRTGEAAWIRTEGEYLERFPTCAGVVNPPAHAFAGVPLLRSGRTIGVFAVCFSEEVAFEEADRAFLLTLARQCAQAIERGRLIEDERAARAEAEKVNRAKDEFLGIVSHELRTPLNAVLGWASLLTQAADDRTTVARGAAVIERNARAQAKIIEDILDVSRIISGKLRIDPRAADLGVSLRAAVDAVRSAAEAKGVALELLIPDEPCVALGDPDRLQQVFSNLLANAIKFTQRGGRVAATIERGEAWFVLRVKDTGQGILSDFLPVVFDRFRQADSSTTRAHGGLGLGLAIARHLVLLHGGTICAESEGLGRGATFTVTLPVPAVRPAEAERTSSYSAISGEGILNGLRVLIVDDEPDARDLIARVLGQSGAYVIAVSSAREAIDVFESAEPDVLVSDIGMPNEDGFDLIRNVRALRSPRARIPAVALTAYARPEDARRAFLAGFQVHVSKPVEPATLTAVVANLGRLGAAS